MKKILFLIVMVLVAACSKENDPAPYDKGQLDPSAVISIRPAIGLRSTEYLSAKEIVKQAWDISFWNDEISTESSGSRGFAEIQKDTIEIRLKMWGLDIIDQNGAYVTEFINGRDIVLRRNLTPDHQPWLIDTIAYIPNTVILAARSTIRAAYLDEDYTRVYALFDSAFRFTPITGLEWRALKLQGLN